MKTKSVFARIKRSSQLIDRFKINEEAADGDSRAVFQDFIMIYNDVVQSANEFSSLKKELTHKQKSLKDSIEKLSKVRKSARKALRGSIKSPVKSVSRVDQLTKEATAGNGKAIKNTSNRTKAKSKEAPVVQ